MGRRTHIEGAIALSALTLISFLCLGCASQQGVRKESPRYGSSLIPRLGIVLEDTSRVSVGDSVGIVVWSYPEFTTHAVVKTTGTVSVPLIGEIQVVGLTKEEFVLQVSQRLKEFIKGEARLAVVITNPIPRITVVGSVLRQGSYPTLTNLSLLEVLSEAGGWNEDADLRTVQIAKGQPRQGEDPVVEVDLEWLLLTGKLKEIPMVQPGDIVHVPLKENVVRTLSEFFRDLVVLLSVFALAAGN